MALPRNPKWSPPGLPLARGQTCTIAGNLSTDTCSSSCTVKPLSWIPRIFLKETLPVTRFRQFITPPSLSTIGLIIGTAITTVLGVWLATLCLCTEVIFRPAWSGVAPLSTELGIFLTLSIILAEVSIVNTQTATWLVDWKTCLSGLAIPEPFLTAISAGILLWLTSTRQVTVGMVFSQALSLSVRVVRSINQVLNKVTASLTVSLAASCSLTIVFRTAAVIKGVPASNVFIRSAFIALVVFLTQILLYKGPLIPDGRYWYLCRMTKGTTRIFSGMAFVRYSTVIDIIVVVKTMIVIPKLYVASSITSLVACHTLLGILTIPITALTRLAITQQ